MSETPWEHGSEFHWHGARGPVATSGAARRWLSSGRDALRFLVAHGRRTRGWQRFWMPSYFCQEVVQSMIETDIDCRIYPDRPGVDLNLATLGLSRGDAILVVNQLGLRAQPEGMQSGNTSFDVVEDHTHDPWSEWADTSTADFAISSLRKCLPLPDGTPAWSPRGHELPPTPPLSQQRELAVLRKLEGMLLKSAYLSGGFASKDEFRHVMASGETHIADGPISAASRIGQNIAAHFDVVSWRDKRKQNWVAFARALGQQTTIRLVEPAAASGSPFSVVLRCDNQHRRDSIRRALIAANIYPAILWPLEPPLLPGVGPEDIALSRQILSIHCDGRYDASDMEKVADVVIEANRVVSGT